MDKKKLDHRYRAASIVSSLVVIGLIVYGIKTKRKVGFYALALLFLAPAAGMITLAATGPMLNEKGEDEVSEKVAFL
jgi:purine-cytosine permease-like protein